MQETRIDGKNLQELFIGKNDEAIDKAMDKRLREEEAEFIRRIPLTNKQAVKFALAKGVHLPEFQGKNKKPRGRR